MGSARINALKLNLVPSTPSRFFVSRLPRSFQARHFQTALASASEAITTNSNRKNAFPAHVY